MYSGLQLGTWHFGSTPLSQKYATPSPNRVNTLFCIIHWADTFLQHPSQEVQRRPSLGNTVHPYQTEQCVSGDYEELNSGRTEARQWSGAPITGEIPTVIPTMLPHNAPNAEHNLPTLGSRNAWLSTLHEMYQSCYHLW